MKLVRIKAMWCSGCLAMRKVWNKMEEEYPNLEITDLDYDMDEEEVSKYNPGKILPVIILVNDDKEVDRLTGEKKIEEIQNMLEKYM